MTFPSKKKAQVDIDEGHGKPRSENDCSEEWVC